ncbi:DUF4236 domain-containing protein [Ralstonia solanacearum]
MGFYVRQSVKVGPLRFNFSKSGVGVSTGVKGIRIGTGPRGNYIHMGRGGCTTEQPSQRPHPETMRRPDRPRYRTIPIPHTMPIPRQLGQWRRFRAPPCSS